MRNLGGLVLCLLLSTGSLADVKSQEAFDIRNHLGSKGPYRTPPGDEGLPLPPEGCASLPKTIWSCLHAPPG